MTTEEALNKINPVINNRYKILKLDYKNKYTKVECLCNSCNNIWTTTYTSLYNQKSGCPKCKLITISNKKKFTQEMAEAKLDEISKNKYTYKPFRYTTNGKTRVFCKCLKCNHKWETSYMKLTSALTGCPKCVIENNKEKYKLNIVEVLNNLNKVSKDKYIYNLEKYENLYSLVSCKCLKCNHKWDSSYIQLVKHKSGCPKCAIKTRSLKLLYTQEEAVNKMKSLKPNCDFSKFKYIRSDVKGLVICENKHEWMISLDNFIQNKGCPKCNLSGHSKPEKEIVNFIKSFYNGKLIENNRNIILNEYSNNYLELDIYLPDINLAIEFNGRYWHSDEMIKENKNWFNSADEYHQYKTRKCKEKDIELIHIDEKDYIKNKNEILNNIKNKISKLNAY